ncbi:MAG: orotate phosphoribosyltransferase [Planctomycetes bacterium]|nr:orotate phosphoribosyltransferase [Planctomycetota bacterium]
MTATLTETRAFVEFLLDTGVLAFGDFQTKSGRRTPYFMDFARFSRGSEVQRLGSFYARAIRARLGEDFDVLFGPAYKGIPLVVATAMTLSSEHGRDASFCFNRKEAKDHGEGGRLVGHKLKDGDRVVIVEDVTTAGTSIRETVPLLRAAAKVRLAGLVVAVDRQERGTGEKSALRELEAEFGMPCFAIASIDEIVAALAVPVAQGRPGLDAEVLGRIRDYRARYGGS